MCTKEKLGTAAGAQQNVTRREQVALRVLYAEGRAMHMRGGRLVSTQIMERLKKKCQVLERGDVNMLRTTVLEGTVHTHDCMPRPSLCLRLCGPLLTADCISLV